MKFTLPKMGESVFEATVVKWLKKEGDKVEQDEPIVQVATDKVDTEIPSPVGGVLKKILVKEGEVAQVGKPIAEIETEEEMAGVEVSPERAQVPAEKGTRGVVPEVQAPAPQRHIGAPQDGGRPTKKFISPLVRQIAMEHNIPLSEVEAIEGTGLGGRVTKRDILKYIEERKKKREMPEITVEEKGAPKVEAVEPAVSAGVPSPAPVMPAPEMAVQPGEVIEMDRVRRLIAEHMIKSKQTSAHTTLVIEATVENIVRWRNKWKDRFQKEEGIPLTFLPVFVQAAVYALRAYPLLNSSVEGTKIIVKKNINIGIAVALPNWNLIVPVIKNADQLSLRGLALKIHDLAVRAREGKLSPDDIKGGTFTISNLGSFGGVIGTPIINQPEVAIMAVGLVQKVPSVVETPYGDAILPLHRVFISLTHDHRIIDGALAGAFLKKVKEYLEQFSVDTPL